MIDPGFYGTTPRDQRNGRRYVQLSFLWALAFMACTFVLAFGYVEPLPLGWLLVFVPSAFALFAARAYWRYLNEMDELLRAIELKALALAMAAGFVVWPAVSLLEDAMELDVHVPVVLLVMTAFYSYGLMKGRLATL